VELQLPAFTKLCIGLGPIVLITLATLATGYCIWVWLRKTERQSSWVGFLATVTGSLFLVTLPIVVAMYLPLLVALHSLSAK
jgi:drug/metabolite transporter superfamily protein YnfA